MPSTTDPLPSLGSYWEKIPVLPGISRAESVRRYDNAKLKQELSA